VSRQHPKLKLQNMDGGELKTGDMSPCQSTIMRALLTTTSTSHFIVCKVWIFRSSKGGVFLLFFMVLFLGIHGVQGGGSYYFFKEGDYKNEFTRKGVLFLSTPLSF
jgi:hypothetical protein